MFFSRSFSFFSPINSSYSDKDFAWRLRSITLTAPPVPAVLVVAIAGG